MKVLTRLEPVNSLRPTCLALGTFDGIHLGHKRVIGRAIETARENAGSSAVLTFDTHPLSVISPEKCPAQITSPSEKARLLADMGLDTLVIVPFSFELLRLSADEFIQLLLHLFSPFSIFVGPNYSFGYQGLGRPDLLMQAGKKYNFQVEVQQAVMIDGQMVSSTLIRQNVASGNVHIAERMLGRYFRLSGKVISGDRRGRHLGFPTANLHIDNGLLYPGDGVYAAYAQTAAGRYPAVVNIGNNPTFANKLRRVEAHLLDFEGDLYGECICLDFVGKIRDEVAFPSAEDLSACIRQDIAIARSQFYCI